MSIKSVFIAILALCLMSGCVSGADCCDYDPYDDVEEDVEPVHIDPYDDVEEDVEPVHIDPGSENVGQQLAEKIEELLDYLWGPEHKFLQNNTE